MRGRKAGDGPQDYWLCLREGRRAISVRLRGVEPAELTAAVAGFLFFSGDPECDPRSTRIIRVQPAASTLDVPKARTADRDLHGIAEGIGVRYDDLVAILAHAWTAAGAAYRARAGDASGAHAVFHGFDGVLPVHGGAITGELTLLHRALASDDPSTYDVVGEALLSIGDLALVLEFDDEIDNRVPDGWQCVTVDWSPGSATSEFQRTEWLGL